MKIFLSSLSANLHTYLRLFVARSHHEVASFTVLQDHFLLSLRSPYISISHTKEHLRLRQLFKPSCRPGIRKVLRYLQHHCVHSALQGYCLCSTTSGSPSFPGSPAGSTIQLLESHQRHLIQQLPSMPASWLDISYERCWL